jgi:opacity protein-like surface antigen
MKLTKLIGWGLLAIVPSMAMASQAGNAVDVYYISSGAEIGDGSGFSLDGDGDGFGAKGAFAIADRWFLNAEYQSADNDFSIMGVDGTIEVEQLRLGIGHSIPLNEQASFYVLGEFIRAELGLESADIGVSESGSESGFGVHAGIQLNVTDAFGLNGRIGYVDIDGDGLEYLIGASYKFTPQVGLFADYRVTELSADGADLDLDDLRVGARFSF